jgi:hypothetical protein
MSSIPVYRLIRIAKVANRMLNSVVRSARAIRRKFYPVREVTKRVDPIIEGIVERTSLVLLPLPAGIVRIRDGKRGEAWLGVTGELPVDCEQLIDKDLGRPRIEHDVVSN